jgi:hypothetical protein
MLGTPAPPSAAKATFGPQSCPPPLRPLARLANKLMFFLEYRAACPLRVAKSAWSP